MYMHWLYQYMSNLAYTITLFAIKVFGGTSAHKLNLHLRNMRTDS